MGERKFQDFRLAQNVTYRRFAIRYFVCAEPLSDSAEGARKVLLYIVNIIKERGPFVFSIDSDNLPVSFPFIDHAENSKNLDWTNFLKKGN
jgi:hypothetical protein